MPGYADVEDPQALLNRDPGLAGGSSVEEAISEAGFQVQAVNWVWEKVVGEDLVESIITPITGDFEQIARGAAQWNNVRDALQAVRNNLNGGLDELQPHWQGEGSAAFSNKIRTIWTIGIEADAQAAKLIGIALEKVADGSRAACDQILGLIEYLVNKLIEAAAMLPIPVVGWGRAVLLVKDAMQIYNKIMDLINGVRMIIDGAQQVIQGIQQVGTALSKIDDINSLNDFFNTANQVGQGAFAVKQGAQAMGEGATQAASAAGELRQTAASAADNARGLAAERGAATDGGATTTSGDGSGTTGTRGSTPASGADDSMAANAGDANTEGRPKECVPGSGDPVDLATGQMFMSQVDLELPGVLPLVLERTHFSSYRVGRFFGRSWASTLDQRIEVSADAVYFAKADGARLKYPVPIPGGPAVLPETGSQLPLSCSADGQYAIAQPKLGRSLHFAPGSARQQLAAITDRNGNRIDFGYDAGGIPNDIRHSGGYHVGIDSNDGVVTRLWLHNPGGDPITIVRFGYNEQRQLTEVFNSSNLPMLFEYDHAGRITQWTDRNGQWYRYGYDADGRVVSSEGSGGALTGTWSYDEVDRITRFTNSLGHTTTYGFNERWQLATETDPLGNTTTRGWDSYNQLLTRTDPLGRTSRYSYDDAGNLTTITRPDGKQVLAEYNELCLPTSITERDGTSWQREYDDRGNLVAVTDPAGAVTRYAYNDRGGLVSTTDALGGVRRVVPNAAGLPVALTDSVGATTRYLRDVFGRVAAIDDATGGRLRLAWTVEGKLRSRTLPDGSTERWSYDGEGNQIEHVDALGQVSRTEFGHFDLPVAQTSPDGARLQFSHDSALRLVSVTNPQGLTWRYEYDAADNLVSETDFNGRTLRYEHDAAGQLATRTNGAGETVSFNRDPLGNVVEKRAADTVTTFAFDAANRMVRASSPDADLLFERDTLGRVLAETVNGSTLRSTYDALGRRVQRLTPSGAESTWTYDDADRPASLTTGGHTVRFNYDIAGREVRRQLGAGAVLAQSWDANHRLISQTITAADLYSPASGSARTVQHRAYHYRPDGYLVGIDDQLAGPRHFELDRAGRVTAVRASGWAERYVYDSAGNITQAAWPTLPNGDGPAEAQGPREYAGTLIRRAGDTVYQHDAQGRVILRQRRTLSGKRQSWTFTWDAEDRLKGVTTPDGAQWKYTYDPLGRRIAKQQVGGATTVFTWDGVTLAEQTADGGTGPATTVWEFEPGSFRPITQTERTPSGVPKDAPQEWVDQQFYALITDLVGTPTEMVDPDGDLAWRNQTTLWGQALAQLTPGPNCPLRFPGQYHDPETGDNYNYHRYYDPTSGRYASNDPLGLAPAPNPAMYVHNPYALIDPLGLAPSCRDTVERHGPMNPGPLSEERTNSFRSGSYDAVTTADPTTLHRVYDGTNSREMGPYWTRTPPAGPTQSIIDSALNPSWGNNATKWVSIEVPAGTTFYEGVAAAQGGLVGGGNQVIVESVNPDWVVDRGSF